MAVDTETARKHPTVNTALIWRGIPSVRETARLQATCIFPSDDFSGSLKQADQGYLKTLQQDFQVAFRFDLPVRHQLADELAGVGEGSTALNMPAGRGDGTRPTVKQVRLSGAAYACLQQCRRQGLTDLARHSARLNRRDERNG